VIVKNMSENAHRKVFEGRQVGPPGFSSIYPSSVDIPLYTSLFSRCMQEEIFGPVVCVSPFQEEEEVINRVNNTR
jgi:acyl-CoA reductase-like NAD-dependent aldehyde dehydrogenase